jgi:hypothetical protein
MRTYFHHQFKEDFKKLNFKNPTNNTARFSNSSTDAQYWGGSGWNNITQDLSNIAVENIEYFILSLFMVTTIDQALHHQFRNFSYFEYSKKIGEYTFPKFGHCGMSIHVENPKVILKRPEELAVVDFKFLKQHTTEFTDLFLEFVEEMLIPFKDKLTLRLFLTNLLDDNDFALTESDKGTIFELVYNSFAEKLATIYHT